MTRVRVSGPESPGARLEIWVEADRALQVGDKLTGRHGNKGVVTAVLEDEAMPEIPGVGAVEAVLNPIGALTRMNLGQLIETHLGWVALHAPNGMEDVRRNTWPATERIGGQLLKKWLREADCVDETGKVRVRLGRNGPRTELPVVVGYQYLMKLNHLAVKKAVFRPVGRKNGPPDYDGGTFQPPRGRRRRGGQRLGEMEMWALAAWSVPNVLAESVALKSDDLATRDELRKTVSRAGMSGMAEVATHLTESWRVFFFLLLGVGIRVELVLKKGHPGQRMSFNWLTAGPVRIDDVEGVELPLCSTTKRSRTDWRAPRSWNRFPRSTNPGSSSNVGTVVSSGKLSRKGDIAGSAKCRWKGRTRRTGYGRTGPADTLATGKRRLLTTRDTARSARQWPAGGRR